MSKTRNFDRREFVKKSVAAAGVVASASAASRLQACPIIPDGNGNRGDWFCIIDFDDSHPIYTIYTWKNCNTGDTYQTWGRKGLPLGDCGDAPNDKSCMEGIEIGRWEQVRIADTVYRIPPSLDNRTREIARRSLAARAERNA